MPQPSYPASLCHHQDVHPSPPRSILEHTAKDGPDDASLKHAQSVYILRSDGKRLVSIEDHRANPCAIYRTFRAVSKSAGSQQSMKPIACTIPMHNTSLDLLLMSVSEDRSSQCSRTTYYYYLEIVAVNQYTASQMI